MRSKNSDATRSVESHGGLRRGPTHLELSRNTPIPLCGIGVPRKRRLASAAESSAHGRIFLGAGGTAAQKVEQQHDQAYHQDDVNEAAGDVEREKP